MSAPEVTWEQIEALRKWRQWGGFMVAPNGTGAASDAIDAILAANPTPWEPSDEDVEAYWTVHNGWITKAEARRRIASARDRGWDVVPRRVPGGSR